MNTLPKGARAAATALAVGSLLTLAVAPAAAQATQAIVARSGQQEVVIRGGWMFDGVSDTRIRNVGIVVRNGKFIQVRADLGGRDLSGAHVIDLDDDATVLPGLIDLHGHYNMSLVRQGRIDEVTYNPLIFLANGVTSTFPAGEYDPGVVMEARKRIDRGELIGPRIFTTPGLTSAPPAGVRMHKRTVMDARSSPRTSRRSRFATRWTIGRSAESGASRSSWLARRKWQ